MTGGALPAGLTLNATTGVISGTPTTAGAFVVTITAVNGRGSTSVTYEGLVRAAEVDAPGPPSGSPQRALPPTGFDAMGIAGLAVLLAATGALMLGRARARLTLTR